MASDTDALQLLHRLVDVPERYTICHVRRADAWRDHEPDSSAFEFFVELYCVENLLAWKVRRQTRRQPESREQINNRVALSGGSPALFMEIAQAATIPRLTASPW